MEARSKKANGRTPFHYASQMGAMACVRHMLQFYRPKAVVVDDQGRLPVHYASLWGHAALVNEFLARGVNQVMEADSSCDTIAHHAARSKSLETLHVALEQRPELIIQNSKEMIIIILVILTPF